MMTATGIERINRPRLAGWPKTSSSDSPKWPLR
jgi:hypothetical protein